MKEVVMKLTNSPHYWEVLSVVHFREYFERWEVPQEMYTNTLVKTIKEITEGIVFRDEDLREAVGIIYQNSAPFYKFIKAWTKADSALHSQEVWMRIGKRDGKNSLTIEKLNCEIEVKPKTRRTRNDTTIKN